MINFRDFEYSAWLVGTVNNEVWKLFFYRCDYGLDLVTYTYVLKVLMFLDQKVNFQPVFCSFLALFGIFSLSSFHVQSLRRTGAKTSRFRLGSPALPGRPGLEARLARCVAGWGSAIFGLYAGFGSLRVTALQAGISRWKETAALQRANDAQLPSKLGTIYYHLQLFLTKEEIGNFYFWVRIRST